MTVLRLAAALLIVVLSWVDASADGFPSRTVTIISPYQAGGTSDIIARILAQKLNERWGKPVVVENKPGANGVIGVNALMNAPADGHTLVAIASSALTLNPIFYPKLSYDPLRDLVPIAITAKVTNVLVVNPSVPADDVASLVKLAKEKPGSLTFASQGIGSNGHVTGEFFKQRAQIDLLHVPYKGSAPAIQDLLAGQIQMMFDNLPSVLQLVRSKQLRALAVTGAERSPELPDVPTVAEAALPGFETSAWFALLAAKGTPASIGTDIEQAVLTTLQTAETREQLAKAGIEVVAQGSAALAARIVAESGNWRDVVSKAGIKPDP